MNNDLAWHEALVAAKARSDGKMFDGIEAVATALYAAEVPRLRQVAMRICKDYDAAEDAVGTVILALPQLIRSYNGTNPRAYFKRRVRNEAIDSLRKQRRHDKYETPDWNTESISEVQQEAVQDLIREIVRTIPPSYRTAYVSFNLEGKPLSEIAVTQEMPLSTVKTGVLRGKAHARTYHGQFEDIFA